MYSSESPKSERRTVECAKCGHANTSSRNQCSRCGARMYIACHHCGHANARVATNCRDCGRRLHRSIWKRLQKRFFGGHARVTPLQIALLVVSVLVAYKIIVYLAEYRPPAFEGG